MKGSHALITGGSSGIGLETARLLAQLGAFGPLFAPAVRRVVDRKVRSVR
jgi:NAD(P)-dependent dehydrogenase (short-subunit alcohol dehydrogenase family)